MVSEDVSLGAGVPVRKSTPADIPGIARLRTEWASEAGGGTAADPHFPDAFRTWLAANPRTFFVAEADQALVGMLNLSVFERMPKPGTPASLWVYLANAYVLPAHRNHGVGGSLLEAAVGFARSINAVRIVTSPSPASRGFYARHGFEAAEELAVYRF